MEYALIILNWLLPLMYLGLLIDHTVSFLSGLRRQAPGGWILAVAAVHAAFLTLRGLYLDCLPMANCAEVLSLVAISSALVFWLVQRRGRDRRAGAFIFLLIFLFQYTSTVLLSKSLLTAQAQHAEPAFGHLHVLPAVMACTALSLAGVHGLLHIVALRNLKRRRFGLLFDRLPPLDELATATWHSLLIGFVCITAAIATGALLTTGASRLSDPTVVVKVAAGSIAWLICLVAVVGKLRKWPAVWVSRLAVSAFSVAVVLLALTPR